jgi:phosphoglycolate phosphatase
MPQPLRYRAVLFDLDGTLVDSYNALAEAVNYARRQQGLDELSAARIRDFVGDGLERLLQRAFNMTTVPRAVQNAFESRYDEICCEESKVLADVEATLAELQKLGVEMAVCTNKPTSFSKKILQFLNLAPYFRAAWTSIGMSPTNSACDGSHCVDSRVRSTIDSRIC